MSIPEKRPIEERTPDDLSYWQPAKELVGVILDGTGGCSRDPIGGGADALLKMLAYIRRHICGDARFIVPVDLDVAIQNLTTCAYMRSGVFYDHAAEYADSLLTAPQNAESPAATPRVDHFQTLADRLADIVEDPDLPGPMRTLLADAAIEAVNKHGGHITSGRDAAIFIRGVFAQACKNAAEAAK